MKLGELEMNINCNFNTDIILKQTQQCELEIMKDIHAFCVSNNIRYSLVYGSALGAIRHKGFIPWDDDIDIVMPREDYEKFISLWNMTSKYTLVNKQTNSDFTQNFTKIKKNNTLFLQKEDIGKSYHKGIFVDIFPADRIPNNFILRKVYIANCLINLLYTRNHNSNSNGFVHIIENMLLKGFSEKRKLSILNKSNLFLKKFNNKLTYEYIFLGDLRSTTIKYPSSIFNKLNLTPFDKYQFFIFNDYDLHLKKVYGNYMEFPPKEKQTWTHAPVEVNFGEIIES